MKNEIETWIDDAAASLGLLIERLPVEDAAEVETKARSQFVIGNPRAWWMSPSRCCDHFDSTTHELVEILPKKTGKAWFIPETEASSLPVYSIDLILLPQLLEECPHFEYYIVSPDFKWLVSESDHNIYFVCRTDSNRPNANYADQIWRGTD
jgi:hypothetical protein